MSGEIHLLKGSDAVLLNEAYVALVERLVGDASRDEVLAEFIGDDYDLDAVVLAAQTVSMFGDRVVVAHQLGRFGKPRRSADVDDADADADGQEPEAARGTGSGVAPLVEYLADPSPDTSLVLVWSPPSSPGVQRGPVPKQLTDAVKRAGGTVSDHGAPTGKVAAKWIDERLEASSVSLDPTAKRLLIDNLGEDVNRLAGVLAVLEATFGSGSEPLRPADVEPFLGDAGGVPPWDLTDAIDGGKVAHEVGNLRRMLRGGGRHPLQVMASLNTHFGRMLRLDGAGVRSEQEAATLLGLKGSTFPAKKALVQSGRLGSERIARATQLLAEADTDLRGRTGVPPEQVMEVLVARLASLSGRAPVSSRPR